MVSRYTKAIFICSCTALSLLGQVQTLFKLGGRFNRRGLCVSPPSALFGCLGAFVVGSWFVRVLFFLAVLCPFGGGRLSLWSVCGVLLRGSVCFSLVFVFPFFVFFLLVGFSWLLRVVVSLLVLVFSFLVPGGRSSVVALVFVVAFVFVGSLVFWFLFLFLLCFLFVFVFVLFVLCGVFCLLFLSFVFVVLRFCFCFWLSFVVLLFFLLLFCFGFLVLCVAFSFLVSFLFLFVFCCSSFFLLSWSLTPVETSLV
ncbi:unnamed protein product [Polarella glacialis]|uniref:Uncharacterized protein n=1 Tax=Polarella glacialis TaxID=89957 RepID=A0A813H4D3_POLGL|nr:unnamed protein product [Polarella glacialis]